MSTERDELYQRVYDAFDALDDPAEERDTPAIITDDLLAAGYRKPRAITTPGEANALPDRSAFLTPGGIIFRKWEEFYGEGKDAWERELGQVVPAELLSPDAHFPATVLHEGSAS